MKYNRSTDFLGKNPNTINIHFAKQKTNFFIECFIRQKQIFCQIRNAIFCNNQFKLSKNKMSSSKNLKVYKIQFVTEVKQMHLNVKFPCSIKMTWKKSNESTETSKVELKNGVVSFNETLKLNVNMYFDTTTNSFVEKKCLYSFLIYTEKGEKSAGTISYDLSEFFNKRIYEVQEDFTLTKCPVPGTKVGMKIFYEESVEAGFDTMSKMSCTNELETSTSDNLNSNDISQLEDKPSDSHSLKSEIQTEKDDTESKKSEPVDLLGDGDVESKTNIDSKMGQNIGSIVALSDKIDQVVSKSEVAVKAEIKALRQRNQSLQDLLAAEKSKVKKLTAQVKGDSAVGATVESESESATGGDQALQAKYDRLLERNQHLENQQTNTEHELERVRINLENVFEHLVKGFDLS